MNLKEQEYMLALGRTGSLTGAAQQLCITQPTLSVFLNNLEERLDTQLFVRAGKKLVPTAAGRAYLSCAQRMELLKIDFETELAEYVRGTKGVLHVGSLRHRSLYLMPRLIRQFQDLHPGVEVILHEDSTVILEKMLYGGELDLLVTNQPLENPALTVQPIYQDRLLAVMGAATAAQLNHNWQWKDGLPYLDLKSVANEVFYLLPRPRSIRILAEAAFRYSNVEPRHIQQITNIDLGCQMAAEELGIAFTMESYHRYFNYLRPTKCFAIGDPALRTGWNAVWRKNAVVPAYMQDFLQLLEDQMRDVRLDKFWPR